MHFFHYQPGNRADNSKTLGQVVMVEQNEIEDRLNQEHLQSLRLKQELTDLENRNAELTEASYISLTKLCKTAENVDNIYLQATTNA